MNHDELIMQLQAAVALHNQGELEKAEEIYCQVLSLDAENYYALRFLGCLKSSNGDYKSAILLLRHAITVSSSDPECWFNLGNAYKAHSQLKEAIVSYRSAEERGSVNAHNFNNWGRCLQDLSMYKESIPIFEKAIEIDRSCFGAWFALGNTWSVLGEVSKSVFCYKRSIDLSPSFVEAYLNLGNILKEDGEIQESISVYRDAIEVNPDFAEAYLNLGNVLKEDGEIKESIAIYRKAIEVKPDFAEAYLNLGNVLKEDGEIKESIRIYRKAVDVKPDFAEVYLNLGNVLKEVGEIKESIRIYRKAIEVKPDFAEAYLNLGNVLNEDGQAHAAIDAFAARYKLQPIASLILFPSAAVPTFFNPISEIVVPESAQFIASYISDAIPFGMHLMYVHIPKSAGVRFSNPIFGCIQQLFLKGGWAKYSDLGSSIFSKQEVSAMASHRIDSDAMRDGIVAALSSYSISALDFSFLTLHGISSCELSLAMRDKFGVQPVRLATWRDPEIRLRSALEYLYRTSEGDLDLVRMKINDKDPFLHNAIYRGCFSDFSPELLPDEKHDSPVDFLIDIGDFSVMNQIMSSFLSRCRLPNIIVNKKVNSASVVKKMDVSLSDSLMLECLDAGFLSGDSSPEVSQMVSRDLPSAFDLPIHDSCVSLNPLTFVVNAMTDQKTTGETWLFSTKYLMTNHGQKFLRDTFAE